MAANDLSQTPWQASGAEKRELVRSMFAEIAPVYDRLNGWMTLSRHRRWRELAVRTLDLAPGAAVLDVCCGTGDFFFPLRRAIGPSGRLLGLDFCGPMLDAAKKKTGEAVLLGDACALPVPDGAFDGVTVGWGLRNVAQLDIALAELARCLRPGARLAVLDMALPRHPVVRALSELACQTVLPLLGRMAGHRRAYTYLPESTKRFASREALMEALEAAGFTAPSCRDLMFGNVCLFTAVKA